MRESMRAGDRQIFFVSVGAALLFGVPVVVLAGLLLVTGWLALFKVAFGHGPHNIHALIWGWLSHRHVYVDKPTHQKYTVWSVGDLPWQYVVSVITAYIFYQVCEALNFGFQSFKKALTPRKAKRGEVL